MGFAWQGTLVGIQPQIRLTRSFDERSHTYLRSSATRISLAHWTLV